MALIFFSIVLLQLLQSRTDSSGSASDSSATCSASLLPSLDSLAFNQLEANFLGSISLKILNSLSAESSKLQNTMGLPLISPLFKSIKLPTVFPIMIAALLALKPKIPVEILSELKLINWCVFFDFYENIHLDYCKRIPSRFQLHLVVSKWTTYLLRRSTVHIIAACPARTLHSSW